MKKAYFAGGCFWHIQYEFNKLKGVIKTNVGYMGGKKPNPSYENVCSGITKHIETVEVIFNPKIIPFKKLLIYFFKIHNYQIPYSKYQYKSVVFNCNDYQKKQYNIFLKNFKDKNNVLTDIMKKTTFYKAEEYHQNYIVKQKTHKQILKI